MSKVINRNIFALMIMVLFSTLILSIDLPKVDDIPYHAILQSDVVQLGDFSDSADDGKISFKRNKPATVPLSLMEGQSYIVNLKLYNPGDQDVEVHVDLYSEDFDRDTEEASCVAAPGEGNYEVELSFYRLDHPDQCLLRVFSDKKKTEVEITDINVDLVNEVTNGNRTVNMAIILNTMLLVISILYVSVYIYFERDSIQLRFDRNELFFYLTVILGVVGILALLYRKAKLDYPMSFSGGDDMGIYYLVKTIKEYGITLVNHRSGGISGGDMFDYPYSDKLSFIIVKIIGLFVDNVYLITNMFYFASYVLIAVISAYVCRKLNFARCVSAAIAILYAFSPYIQSRYGHMWLVPYYMLPIACLISIRIANGDLDGCKETRPAFSKYLILSFLCGFTGMYYAFFSCALFAIAIVIDFLRLDGKERFKSLRYVSFIGSCSFGVLVNVVPNIVYWIINGTSPLSEFSGRTGAETEIYGLKLVQMVLPRIGHRIQALAGINADYTNYYPLVTENHTATLGIVATVGFVIAILGILGKKRIFAESKLIISCFLISTVGGIGTLISVFISLPVRCYNRMSLIIMFLALLIIGRCLENLSGRLNRVQLILLSLLLIGVGIYDQTVTYVPPDYSEFEASRSLVNVAEEQLEAGDMVYVLPCLDWPSGGGYKNHIGYIESSDLIWSYGAAQGREESIWQQKVSDMDAVSMIQALRTAGYDGIYFDAKLFASQYGEEEMAEYSNNITYALGYQPYVSDDGSTYFWTI